MTAYRPIVNKNSILAHVAFPEQTKNIDDSHFVSNMLCTMIFYWL